ncbi:integrase catalytic domain-containing protein [Trichonephila clavipes]|nr:integrase catalytic domain-containing protein [Trichonephila clavipes]
MNEYESLGHMSLVNSNSHTSDKYLNVLPHHAVIKPSSTTTKLRVVFDSSLLQTTNGASLNSLLGVGPKLQRDIFEILLNFRIPRIVFTADIEKMYRQILIADEDQKYQQILWRNYSNENIHTDKLKTVTYGLASASLLATRCNKQIALDNKNNPNLSRTLQEDIYMDDLLSGSDTPNNAISIYKDIAHVLSTLGFHLRKWNSNSTEFLPQFSEHSSHDTRVEFSKDSNESSKVLGLFWSSSNDNFGFQPSLELTPPLTKRHVWVIITADNTVELHGFADASSLAYAAAIYCRQKHNGKIKVQLLLSKTKVASIKQVSIPRLELCGAHLLSKLLKSVLRTLKHYTFDIFAWTDSKIVLSWLSSHPRKWKTFVANRISEIMEVLPTKHWRHVPYKENAADIASRGIDPKCLPDCMLWWQGPPWLRLETSSWPNPVAMRLRMRFIKNCKKIASYQGSSISSSHINTTSLTFSEAKTAEETIIRWVQGIHFQEEIQSIKKQISLPPKSPLRSLHPFIDEHGLVWVGGRLQNSQLRFNSKHPIILPSQHSISELLIKEQHIAHIHTGPTFVKNSKHPPQLMGNLPKHRVTLERPFFSCGIDYAGPVLIKCNQVRGIKSTKGYIALFVCLATKDVHIEAVGNLTTDSFIAALRRFSARRGAPRHIYSDNGTNFVGARDVLLSVPKELPSTSNLRDRWELLQNIKRSFWKKWSSEFISSLQPRKKWQDTQPNLKEDGIVLIKEEGPSGTWPMARVLQVHPGNDGLVRVATVKTQDSVLKRPVHKFHELPIYPN